MGQTPPIPPAHRCDWPNDACNKTRLHRDLGCGLIAIAAVVVTFAGLMAVFIVCVVKALR